MIAGRRIILPLGGLAVLSALMLGLAVLPMPRENLFWRSLFDATHVPVFGVFALVVRLLLDWMRERASLVHDLAALVMAGLLGALIEVAQSFTGRDAAMMDLVRDGLGALALLLATRAVMGRPWRSTFPRMTLAIVALALTAWAFRSPVEGLLAYRQRDAAFPVLCSFDSNWTMRFADTRNVDLQIVARPNDWNNGVVDRVARLTYRTAQYPAFILREPHGDWSGFDVLAMTLFNPEGEELSLNVRIDDAKHNGRYNDRYGGKITLPSGATEVVIPLQDVRDAPRSRKMDLTQVRSVTLFADRPDRARVVYLAEIRLR